MTPTTRRRGAVPDAGAVADLTAPPETAGALTKAPEQDPVLAAAAQPKRASRRAPAAPGSKDQLKVWIDADEAARARAAFLHTRTETGYRSLSDLVGRAILREVKRLEKAHHGGKPWEPAQAGDLPTGRPVGS